MLPGIGPYPGRMSCTSSRRCRARLAGGGRGGAGRRRGVEVVNGQVPRDVIQWRLLTDEADLELEVVRGGLELTVEVAKRAGRAARRSRCTRRCSTRCARATTTASSASSTSCRPGLRRSLYLKDDDYRLSFLYGNFTTLTRFTEADLERVVTERLSPLNVSIHATDPERAGSDAAQPTRRHEPALAAGAARPRHRGARPGRRVPGRERRRRARRHARRRARPVPRARVAVRRAARREPLSTRAAHAPAHGGRGAGRRRHRRALAGRVPRSCSAAGSCSLADEYYLLADRPFPEADAYEGFPMHEDGIGMARTLRARVARPCRRGDRRQRRLLRLGRRRAGGGLPGAPRARRAPARRWSRSCRGETRRSRILTGEYGARVLDAARRRARPRRRARHPGAQRVLRRQRRRRRSAGRRRPRPRARRRASRPPLPAPDVCLSEGTFLDGPRRPTCPARSRSSRPTASPCVPPWASR